MKTKNTPNFLHKPTISVDPATVEDAWLVATSTVDMHRDFWESHFNVDSKKNHKIRLFSAKFTTKPTEFVGRASNMFARWSRSCSAANSRRSHLNRVSFYG